jgi:flotillin
MEKEAEAKGIEAVLRAKAEGYEKLISVAGANAPTILTIEQLPTLVNAQVEAIKNIKVDKITVFDSPNGNGDSSLSHLMKGFTKSLPQLHDIAKNAGIELPEFLGNVRVEKPVVTETVKK